MQLSEVIKPNRFIIHPISMSTDEYLDWLGIDGTTIESETDIEILLKIIDSINQVARSSNIVWLPHIIEDNKYKLSYYEEWMNEVNCAWIDNETLHIEIYSKDHYINISSDDELIVSFTHFDDKSFTKHCFNDYTINELAVEGLKWYNKGHYDNSPLMHPIYKILKRIYELSCNK